VEECDDGNNIAGDGCSPFCILEICGNGVLDPGEGCDDANGDNTDSCANCQPAACGDGYIHAGFEMCDDGNTTGGDGCSADCLSDETCGNGYLDSGEVCDDGNQIDTDACPTTCQTATCGDGFVWSGHETCDDGNLIDGDGCLSACVLDGCGSGTVEGGEECDEGMANGTHGSSCFANCISTDVDVSLPIVMDLDTQSRGQGPRAIETTDFNGDGRPDLITANYLSNDVTVLYGLGDGRFWAPQIRSTGSYPHSVKLADVNGDGELDAITANRNSDTITVFLGNGNGFDPGSSYSVVVGMGGDQPYDLAVADLAGDANLDVVTANYASDNVTLLVGDGTGAFTATTLLSTMSGPGGDAPIAVKVADVTNDSTLDIVTANRNSDDVTVLEGLGSGNFAPAAVYTTRVGAGGDGPEAIALADVSGDTVPDVITANYISDDITVLTADGTGGLNSPVRFSTLDGSAGQEPRGVAVADVTQDGQPDVITANYASDDISILPGVSGGAAFDPAIVISIADGTAGDAPRGVAVADLNGDTVPDIITSNTLSDDVSVLVGQGGGNFAAVRVFESKAGYTGDDPRSLAVGDVNNDGTVDVVTANEDTGNISVVVGLGDGLLAPAQTVSTGSNPRGVAAGDLDGDGDMDWVAAEYISERVRRALMRESGDFTTTSYVPFESTAGDNPIAVALGNVDGDTDLDLATATETDNGSVVMYNNGSGGFSSPDYFSMGTANAHVVLADVTGDGNLDLVTVSPTQDTVIIRPGNGSGGFGGSSALSTSVSTPGQGPVFVTVADVTGDTVPDILTANRDSNDVTLLVGLGSGSFNAPIIIPAVFLATPATVSCVRVGHFNADNIVDIATANANRDTVSIILGFGNGDFAAPQSFDVGVEPYAIAVADFDGDGTDDIAAADYADGTVTVLRGLGHP
jgi:cysteine-rich repeat protein